MALEQHVVDYFSDSLLKLGWVLREQKTKLLVVDAAGRNERVTPANVLLSHGTVDGGRASFAEFARQLEGRVADLMAEVDCELLWESLSSDGAREFSAEQLASEYFGEASPIHAAAVARAVLNDSLRFRRVQTRFRPRSRAEAERESVRREREAARAALRERAVSWLRGVVTSDSAAAPTIPPDLNRTVQSLEDYILAGGAADVEALLQDAFPRRPPRATGIDVLSRLGRLPAHLDRWLLERGAFPTFPKSVVAFAAALPEYSTEQERTDVSGLAGFSIDDADTREIDDALTVDVDGDRLLVGVHIADPSVFVHRDDPVDRVASRRPLSLYLPTTMLPMLPERIGCDLASLNAGRLRPCLSFRLVFDREGRLAKWAIDPGQISVARRLTYEEAESLMAGSEANDPVARALRRLLPISESLRARRLERGALLLVRPEPKIRVRDGQIEFSLIDGESPARRLVAELMVLANSLAALYALRNDIPVIYRVQDPPKNPIQPMTEYDPIAFETAVRAIARSRFSTHPQAHAGLGVDVYTQLSSPIRRYSDMVLQRQLIAHFRGEAFPYSPTELIEVLGLAEAQERENRQLERVAVRYWTLEYLRRQDVDAVFQAVALPGNRGRFVELSRFVVRGQLTGTAEVSKGAGFDVRIIESDPEHDRLLVERV